MESTSSSPTGKGPPLQIADFDLLKQIGAGSYGEVWLARNVLGGFRAIKIVSRASFREERPFTREFEGIRNYEPISRSHESLVTIFHVARDRERGFFYYVMELGDDLRNGVNIDPGSYNPKTLGTDLGSGHSLAAAECLRVTMALAGALVHLHAKGLIHRDIKPSNIIFVNEVPKLADIGLVAALGESASFVGTEGFVPPEGPGSVQADIYSLGKVLYEMISGKDRSEFPELPREWAQRPDRPTFIELNEICLKACHGDVKERYQTASELLADLAILQSGRSVKSLRAAEVRAARLTRATIAFVLIALLASGAWMFSKEQLRTAETNAVQSEDLRVAAKKAERAAREQLRNALLSQSEAHRMNHLLAGSIAKAWQAVADAAAIKADERARDEAIALAGYSDFVNDIAEAPLHREHSAFTFSDDLELYASGTARGELRIGSLRTGAFGLVHDGKEMPLVDLLHFSPDKRWLAVRYYQLSCFVYDLQTSNVVMKTRWGTGVTKPDRAFDFSPLGTHAASAVTETIVRIFHLPDWSHGPALTVTAKPTWLAFSPDGKQLAVAAGKNIEVWRLATMTRSAMWEHASPVFCVDWRPDSKLLAAGTAAGELLFWNTATDDKQLIAAHAALILSVSFDREGATAFSSSYDRTTRFWKVDSKELLMQDENGLALKFSSVTNEVGVVREGQSLTVREYLPPPAFRTLTPPEKLGEITRLRVAHEKLLVTSRAGAAILNVNSGALIATLAKAKSFDGVFDEDDAVLLGNEKGIAQWRYLTNSPVAQVWEGNRVSRMSPVRGGGELLFSSHLRLLHVERKSWNVVNSWQDEWLTGGSNICDVALSPDERSIALAGWYSHGPILLEFPSLKGHAMRGPTSRFAFSPDSSQLAIGEGQSIRVVNVKDFTSTGVSAARNVVGEEPGPVAFSPDGKALVALGNYRDLQLLEAKTGRVLARLRSPRNEVVTEVVFNPQGTVIIFGTKEGGVYAWDLPKLRETLADAGLKSVTNF